MNEPDPAPDPGPDPGPEPAPPLPSERRYPRTVGGFLYLLVLVVTALGIVVGSLEDWRLGVRIVGGALIGGGVLRLVLRQRDAGMLAVRNRLVDVGLLVAMGVALLFLAADIPGRPV